MQSRKRKRADVDALRKENRDRVSREVLTAVLDRMNSIGLDNTDELHKAGVHQYFVDYNCAECFVTCDWCLTEHGLPVEDTEKDPDDPDRLCCLHCIKKAHRIAAQIKLE